MSTKEINEEGKESKEVDVVSSGFSSEIALREAEVPEATETFNKSKGRYNYGEKNLHPQFLYKLVEESPIHGGIVGQKVDFVYGDGVVITGGDPEAIQSNGASKFTLDEVVEEVVTDNEVLAYYYLLFKRKDLLSPWYTETLSGELVRPGKNLTTFQYSEDWLARSQSFEKTKWKVYKSIFVVDKENDLECVMYVKAPAKQTLMDNGKLTSSVFPTQRYSGAIPSILADIEMNVFHYSESVNGWTSNTILQFLGGEPEPDKKRKFLKDLKDQTTDRKKKGGTTVIFADGKERAMQVLNLNGNNNDTRYLLSQEHGFQTIMIAHRVQNPALFGLQVSGKLGRTSAEESLVDYKKFMGTYASKARKRITESIEEGYLLLNNWNVDIEFKDFMPDWLGGDTTSSVGGEGGEIEDVAGTAMNGAQIASLVGIVEAVGTGVLSPESAVEVITTAFPTITIEKAQKIVGLGAAFVAKFKDNKADKAIEASIVSMLEKLGRSREVITFVDSKEFVDFANTEQSESEFIIDYVNQSFADDLTEDQHRILQMINKGESYKAVVDAVGEGHAKPASYVSRHLIDLTRLGYVEEWALTEKGVSGVATQEMISVVYSYELRPDAPALVAGGESRDFCATLISLNRVYTREEIESISTAVDRNVWLYRGGWYHNPDTDNNTPSCRHFWKQNIILL